jgi:Protein of unknown function (DUF2752)
MEINFCPRWLLLKTGISPEAEPHLALFLSALLTLLASPLLVDVPHICLVHALVGIPCPGCGILHGMAALSKMNVAAAWSANPASFFLAALLALQLLVRPVALCCTATRRVIARVSNCLGVTALTALLLVWIDRLVVGGLHGCGLLS